MVATLLRAWFSAARQAISGGWFFFQNFSEYRRIHVAIEECSECDDVVCDKHADDMYNFMSKYAGEDVRSEERN